MSLPEALERAASSLPALADQIRPANGDAHRLLDLLSAQGAAQVLACVLANDAPAADELLEVWSELERGAAALVAVDEAALPKDGRKQLRRALHRLRARGVAVEAPSAPTLARDTEASAEAAGRRGALAADRWQAAHLSAPDFRGTRMAYLVDSHPAGGARLFEIRFDPARGILDFRVYNAPRSRVRGFLKSLIEGTQQRLFEVDQTALCALVRRASHAQPVDRPLPDLFVEWRGRLFGEALEQQAVPGELARRALADATDLAASAALVEEAIRSGRMGPWPPSTTWVSERMERAQKAVEGRTGEARASAVAAWGDDVAGELEVETPADRLSEQLSEWAWIEWQRGEMDRARGLLAVATGAAGASGAGLRRGLARARVDALFAPFLEALAQEIEAK